MDKLRALQYFVAAAGAGSFSSAAREFDVSAQAVAKLICALELQLGVKLFERSARGMSLTAAGTNYMQACAPALTQLLEADENTRGLTVRSAGTVVVGVQHVIARGCLTAALPRFHSRFPDIALDVRDIRRATDEDVTGLDVMLTLGWPKVSNVVQRRIGAGRFMVVAAPAYWAAHGVPQRPKDLEKHVCLPIRGVDGTVMDLWTFVRGAEQEAVAVGGWLTTSNSHRDLVIELALAGEGVIRILDWTNRTELASGRLVEVLGDWESPDVVPINLLYRPSVRRIPRVKTFIDFVTELFREMDAHRGRHLVASERPNWLRRHHERTSSAMWQRP